MGELKGVLTSSVQRGGQGARRSRASKEPNRPRPRRGPTGLGFEGARRSRALMGPLPGSFAYNRLESGPRCGPGSVHLKDLGSGPGPRASETFRHSFRASEILGLRPRSYERLGPSFRASEKLGSSFRGPEALPLSQRLKFHLKITGY